MARNCVVSFHWSSSVLDGSDVVEVEVEVDGGCGAVEEEEGVEDKIKGACLFVYVCWYVFLDGVSTYTHLRW